MVGLAAKRLSWVFIRNQVMDHCIHHTILFYPITLEDRRGTTDEFATIPFHLVLFSTALVELTKSIPVHSLILSSHLFFCLPLFLFSFTMPCRIVFAKPEDLETGPNHLSFQEFVIFSNGCLDLSANLLIGNLVLICFCYLPVYVLIFIILGPLKTGCLDFLRP